MELNHEALRDMQINSVGDRMRILIVIKRIKEALKDPLKYSLLRSGALASNNVPFQFRTRFEVDPVGLVKDGARFAH